MSKQKTAHAGKQMPGKRRAARTEATSMASNVATPSASSVADASREGMIAEAAYYRAQKRGFVPGRELDDWLAAEAEVSGYFLEQGPGAGELH